MSDIIKFRQLIENGYTISQISTDNLGQTSMKLSVPSKSYPFDQEFYFFTTKDQAVIQKANEIIKNNKKV